MRHSWFFSLLLAVGLIRPAFAGPTVTAVSGASATQLTGTVTIFGGLAGAVSGCTANDTYSTCNSCNTTSMASTGCTSAPFCSCNTARIYDQLIMTINFTNTTTDANGNTTTTPGGPILVTAGSATTLLPGFTSDPNGNMVQTTWSTICAQVGNGAGSSCDALTGQNASVSLNFYSDANRNGAIDSGETATAVTFRIINPGDGYATFTAGSGDGIGAFEPYPGDGKVYIKDPQTSTSFPSLGYSAKVKNVRVFYASTNLGDANPTTGSYKDLAVTEDGSSLAKNVIDGLENGKLYFFRLGMLDEANNLTQLSPDPNDTEAASSACTTGTEACKFSAKPDHVEGLLPNDFNCFVATAAYGSMLEPKLKVFREFRARVLLPSRLGRKFVFWYYANGPYAARYLKDKPTLRAVTRGLLWPAYGFSWLALRYGTRAALTALAAALAALYWLAHLTYARGFGRRE